MVKKLILIVTILGFVSQPLSASLGLEQNSKITTTSQASLDKRSFILGAFAVVLGANLMHMGLVISSGPACALAAVCMANGAYNLATANPEVKQKIAQKIKKHADKYKEAVIKMDSADEASVDQRLEHFYL